MSQTLLSAFRHTHSKFGEVTAVVSRNGGSEWCIVSLKVTQVRLRGVRSQTCAPIWD